jgi:hypothetical protein
LGECWTENEGAGEDQVCEQFHKENLR